MINIINSKMLKIEDVAKKVGIDTEVLYKYGSYIAKVPYDYKKDQPEKANLILVTAMTPTKSGEGKTLTSISLSMALNALDKKTVACLRQGSLGPVFGMKGACIGSGHAMIQPAEELCLGLTGDFDAVSTANNLIAAVVDNHIYQGNTLNIDPNKIVWKRCMDLCDRQLRNIEVGKGKKVDGVEHTSHFDITAASEILSILTFAKDIDELKSNIGDIIVGYTYDDKPVYAKDLKVDGAVIALLSKAFNPNLVQTSENTPVLVHGGCFANISTGTNTIVCTKLGMRLADYVVTEAGFASDLGAEKFLDIKCRKAGIEPKCVVVVATVKALRHHGGAEDENKANTEAVKEGLKNLVKHIKNLQDVFNQKVVVAINRFPDDTVEEIKLIENCCKKMNVLCSLSTAYAEGSKGALDLAKNVIHMVEETESSNIKFAYETEDLLGGKICSIAKKVYGAKDVLIPVEIQQKLDKFMIDGYSNYSICIAKTQYSFSDNAKLLNVPEDFTLKVTDVEVKNGAKMIVVLCGSMVLMPGLPKVPKSEGMDFVDGKIVGLS